MIKMAARKRNGVCLVYSLFLLFQLSVSLSDYPKCLEMEEIMVEGNLTLQEALKNIKSNTTICYVVNLGPESHYLRQKTQLQANVILKTKDDATNAATISCAGIPEFSGQNDTFELAILTFTDSEYVELNRVIFEYCPLPIQMLRINKVNISDCKFQHFSEAAVNMYNCIDVEVSASMFLNNTAKGIFVDYPYRGNGGGLSFGVHNLSSQNPPPTYNVQNCKFENNSAFSNATFARSTTDIIADNIFNGRGGGLAFVPSQASTIYINVTDCCFIGNRATSFAGGLYFLSATSSINHTYDISDCVFLNNTSGDGGGAVGVGIITEGDVKLENQIFLTNLTFRFNSANSFGGGLYIIPGSLGGIGNLIFMRDCKFYQNSASRYGAAVAIAALRGFLDRSRIRNTTFIDNVFEENFAGSSGVFSVYYFTVIFKGTNTFKNNFGTSLRIVSSLVRVNGALEFEGNNAPDGSAIYVSSFGQINLYKNSELKFMKNRGRIGAAIEVEPTYVEPFLEQSIYNEQCFLLYEEKIPPDNWTASITFSENEALIGSALYIQSLNLCSWRSLETPFFSKKKAFRSNPFVYNNNINMAISTGINDSDSDIATPAVNFTVSTDKMDVFPGSMFVVDLSAWDELGHPTAGIYNVEEIESEDEYELEFSPSSLAVFPDNKHQNIYFGSTSQDFDSDIHNVTFSLQTNSRFDPEVSSVVRIIPRACPPGQIFSPGADGSFVCTCDNDNPHITDCVPGTSQIILRGQLWGVSYVVAEEDLPVLVAYPCPDGYCKCDKEVRNGRGCMFLYQEDDNDTIQCHSMRQGRLCGECVDGLSWSALLDTCVQCGNVNSFLIVGLILVDAIVILSIMILSQWKEFHLPAILYPFLFYIQVAPYATRSFLESSSSTYAPLFYIGSLSSLYFPYDFCLYSNATALELYGIKYIPFMLAIIICPIVLVVARCVKDIQTDLNYSGLWMILLLLYNHIVYVSSYVLNCPLMVDKNGVEVSTWFVNGEIPCFTGGHIALGLWAILCLIIASTAILLPSIIVGAPDKITDRRLRSSRGAIVHVYREKYYWWHIVELSRRFLLIIVIVASPGNRAGTAFILMISFLCYAYAKPYKKQFVTIFELLLLLDFLVVIHLAADLLMLTRVHSTASITVRIEVALLVFFYYLPFLLLLLFLSGYTTYFLVKALRDYIEARKKEKIKLEEAQAEMIGYPNRFTRRTLKITSEDTPADKRPSLLQRLQDNSRRRKDTKNTETCLTISNYRAASDTEVTTL